MKDGGIITVCELTNTAETGEMPKDRLSPVFSDYFEERLVGYGRFYQAKGVQESIDMLVRINRTTSARIGMYAVLSMSENDGQYRITNVQQMLDFDNLKCTDLTLSRLERLYDVATVETVTS